MKKITIMTILIALLAMNASALPLEYWTFDDAVTHKLDQAANSGSNGSLWDWSNAEGTTDGAGNFVLQGDGGNATRKLPKKNMANAHATEDRYATPYTTGKYRLEVDFASWDFSTNSVGANAALKAVDSNDIAIAGIRLNMNSTNNVQVNLYVDKNDHWTTWNYSLAEVGGAKAAVEFDFDNNTVDYYVDGVKTKSFTDFSAGNFSQLTFQKLGDGWTDAATTVKMSAFGLSQLP
jgi:hypothetical protein